MLRDNPRPTSDFVFRKLFGSEENKDLLISLINAVIQPMVPIVDVVIKNPFNMASYEGAKESILDIKAVDENGVWYDIEMQILGHVFYGKRALYYAASTYVNQLEAGEDYSTLNTTIGIHFLGFNLFDDDRVTHQFMFRDAETGTQHHELSYLQLYFVELGKFHKDWPELTTLLDRWLAFMTHGERLHRKNLPAVLDSEPSVAKAVTELERLGSDPAMRAAYEGEERSRMASVAEIQYAVEQERKAKTAEIQYAVEQERKAKASEIQYAVEQERKAKASEIQHAVEQERKAKTAEIQYAVEQAQRHTLHRLLSRHLGEIPADISARVDTLAASQLDALTEAIFDLNSYDDVQEWLSASS